MNQAPESLMTAIVRGVICAICAAGFLLTKTTALDGLVRVAALVIYGDAS
ncbi:hypothetical protein [Ancylobacter polymorphus]|uniref:DUF2892 domain-containing protein n=1 Tax=Ancylobacter polymorphus TaxID=223390 RepID=A0ABU0BDF2_9HYPH|nr:hypothetical protein [Ancylobacter polymorphus]MDQ0303846.1 hypothetical protein [Ancylobacter polymorphus]